MADIVYEEVVAIAPATHVPLLQWRDVVVPVRFVGGEVAISFVRHQTKDVFYRDKPRDCNNNPFHW